MATTKKDLQYALERIAELTGQATSKGQAVEMGKDFYLWLDYSSAYGGYRVVNVRVGSGAHYGALGSSSVEGRLKASEMLRKLEGIEYGIEHERRGKSISSVKRINEVDIHKPTYEDVYPDMDEKHNNY